MPPTSGSRGRYVLAYDPLRRIVILSNHSWFTLTPEEEVDLLSGRYEEGDVPEGSPRSTALGKLIGSLAAEMGPTSEIALKEAFEAAASEMVACLLSETSVGGARRRGNGHGIPSKRPR